MRHFRHMLSYPTAPLRADVAALGGRWGDITFRQAAPGSPHPQTETVYLRMPPEVSASTVFHGVREEVCYPAWYEAPTLAYAAAELAGNLGRSLARVLLVKLKPGGVIAPHVDQGVYSASTDRFHLAIESNPFAWLEAGGETRSMEPGELWYFNKDAMHSGANYGDTDRVHLIMDLYRNGIS